MPAAFVKRLLPRSLTTRVVALSTLWAVLALIVIATVISTLFRQASERGFESLLSAHLFNLISTVSITEQGLLVGSPNLGDLRFTRPGSGWYWNVAPVSDDVYGELRSLSMTESVPAPSATEVPFDNTFRRRYETGGLDGERLQVIESEYLLDAEDRVARFRMMGNLTELEEEIANFNFQLYTYLLIFGISMIAINAFMILIGLQPLARVRRALADIRTGSAQRLDGTFPSEIAPLAEEANALIESNRRIVERARTQVGNLAHSLKTPLAVIINEGRVSDDQRGRLVVQQAEAMRQQIEHYLQRARIAAQRDVVTFRTPMRPLLERMVRVVRKLAADKVIRLEMSETEIVFAGEKEDMEEIVGNLLENAVKWSRRRIVVHLEDEPAAESDGRHFQLVIEDDGPGIPREQAREALRRGHRLDETKPGTGLGLAIVSDLVAEYDGVLRLETSGSGGLRVVARLKQAPL